MRVLALADKRPPVEPAEMARQMGVEAVLCLGDLDRAWIESLISLALPRYGVHGNHDPEHVLRELEIEDLHLRRTHLGDGLTMAGFEGCVRYGRGTPTSTASARQAVSPSACPRPTCCSATARRSASTTTPRTLRTSASRACATGSTATTRGTCCTATRTRSPGRTVTRYGDTRVHWISGARVLDLR